MRKAPLPRLFLPHLNIWALYIVRVLWLCAQDGKAEAATQIEALERDKKKLERKLTALTAKSSALKEANEAQTVTLDGLQARTAPSALPCRPHLPLLRLSEIGFLQEKCLTGRSRQDVLKDTGIVGLHTSVLLGIL